jgi:hypothetical protein
LSEGFATIVEDRFETREFETREFETRERADQAKFHFGAEGRRRAGSG